LTAKGGEIGVGKDQEAPGLDPAKNPASAAIRVFELMYSRLTCLDAQMQQASNDQPVPPALVQAETKLPSSKPACSISP